MGTTYPLEIRDCSGDDSRCLMSKGHHDFDAFMAAAREYWGEELTGWEAPQHLWWRVLPAPPGSDFEHIHYPAEPGARGAFPATTVEQF